VGLPRLSEAAARVLDRAHDEARRRGHRAVDAGHVLAAFASMDEHSVALARRGIDRTELRMVVDATLASRPEEKGYRDGVASLPLSPGLRAAIEGARRSPFARLVAVRADQLLEATARDATGAFLGCRATARVETLDAALRRIDADTDARHLSIEHVLRALAEERWLVFAVRAAGGDVERLREVLDDAIAARVDEDEIAEAAAELSTSVQRTTIHATAAGVRAMCDLFVVRAVQLPRIGALFDRAGVRPVSLVRVLVHGDIVVDDDATDARPDELVDVVFHDDDVTTMELVVRVLVTCFDMEPAEASEKMLLVHGNGASAVATLPADDARSKVILARDLARSHGAPLRIALRKSSRV
jgi:ATP-dependent Clp protease adapter protein ClpS